METLEVYSQKEYDELPEKFDDPIRIIVDGPPDKRLSISRVPYNALIEIRGETRAEVSGNCIVFAYDKTFLSLHDEAWASLNNYSMAAARDKSKVHLYDRSFATLENNAKAFLYGGAHAVLRGQSEALAFDKSMVEARDQSKVRVFGEAYAIPSGGEVLEGWAS